MAQGEGQNVTRTMRLYILTAAVVLLPFAAAAQRSGDTAYIEGRLKGLQQQVAELSARVERLRAQDQELQRRLESMRTKVEARLQPLAQRGTARGKAR